MSRPPELSRRERNKADVRSRLVAAALKLAAAPGYDATTVDDITTLAGVAKGTFFNYFPTKEALVVDHYRRLFAGVEAILRALPPLPPEEWFVAWFTQMAQHLAKERDAVIFVLREASRVRSIGALERAAHVQLHQAYVGVLERGKAKGQVARGVDSGRAASVLQAVWSATLEEWAANPSMRLGTEVTGRVHLVFHGLVGSGVKPPRGRRRI